MNERVATRWHELQDSLWFLPSILTVCGIILATVLVQVDHSIWGNGGARQVPFIFGGGAEGARGVLGAIAGSLITVTATLFSITVVALQLAAGQMTPRVLRNFTGDRRVQFVLGVFIATFTYSLLVLRSIRSADADNKSFVPYIAVTVAIILALASVGVLIFFIHHIARSIQVAVVVDRVADDTIKLVERHFPTVDEASIRTPKPISLPPNPGGVVRSESIGYIQAFEDELLFSVARDGLRTVNVERRIGEFIIAGAIIARVWPASDVDDDVQRRIRQAFVLGLERTLQADLDLGIRQLSDIAIKALSPGINDPTTATICIDRLSAILAEFVRHEAPPRTRADDNGGMVIFKPALSFAQLADAAFTQIRHYGAGDPVVAAHLITALEELAGVAPRIYRSNLERQARLVVANARQLITVPEDLAWVEHAARWSHGTGGDATQPSPTT